MSKSKLSRVAGTALAAALVATLALSAPSAGAQKKKFITKTYTKGVGGGQGGVPLRIPDGAGQASQLVHSPIKVKKLNPRGKIKDVDVSVRLIHPTARDIELYLASPRGVIELSSDNGGNGSNYGGGFASCGGDFTVFDNDVPTPISTPGIQAPFVGRFAPEQSLDKLKGLGGKKAKNANWSLMVLDDDSAGMAGTLICWKLRIKQTNPKIGRKKR